MRKERSTVTTTLALAILLAAPGCGSEYVPDEEGTKGGPCRTDGTCDAGLECISDICVDLTGVVICSPGQVECASGCTDTDVDPGNCGGCEDGSGDYTCLAGEVCDGTGSCALSCQDGLTDCSGVCTDTRYDPDNCNVCEYACDATNATAACVLGVCMPVCEAGFGDCDTDPDTGCETDLMTDEQSCGFCGNECPAGTFCEGSACSTGSSSMDLLIVTGNASGAFETCLVAGLTPYFDSVTSIVGPPTPAELVAIDAVLVYNNGDHTDPVAMGNVLADFFDAKGHVVEALYGTTGLDGMAGRWASDGYALLGGSYNTASVSLGTIAEPASPLMDGVSVFVTTRSCTGGPINGGIVVASYTNGQPLVVRGTKNGHNRVDLGMFPGGCNGGYWTGDGFDLIRNALTY